MTFFKTDKSWHGTAWTQIAVSSNCIPCVVWFAKRCCLTAISSRRFSTAVELHRSSKTTRNKVVSVLFQILCFYSILMEDYANNKYPNKWYKMPVVSWRVALIALWRVCGSLPNHLLNWPKKGTKKVSPLKGGSKQEFANHRMPSDGIIGYCALRSCRGSLVPLGRSSPQGSRTAVRALLCACAALEVEKSKQKVVHHGDLCVVPPKSKWIYVCLYVW